MAKQLIGSSYEDQFKTKINDGDILYAEYLDNMETFLQALASNIKILEETDIDKIIKE